MIIHKIAYVKLNHKKSLGSMGISKIRIYNIKDVSLWILVVDRMDISFQGYLKTISYTSLLQAQGISILRISHLILATTRIHEHLNSCMKHKDKHSSFHTQACYKHKVSQACKFLIEYQQPLGFLDISKLDGSCTQAQKWVIESNNH